MTQSSISLQTVTRLYGEELSRISHALRTPLTSIVGFADAILSDPTLEAERKDEFTKIIRTEGERLSKFVDELLCLSFVAGEPSALQSCDLATLVSSAFHNVSVAAASRGISLEYEILSDQRRAAVDRIFISKMLVNILSNAIRYSFEGTRLLVQAELKEGMLELRVRGKRQASIDHAASESVGLARTKYLLGINGGTLTLQQRESNETVISMRLPIKD